MHDNEDTLTRRLYAAAGLFFCGLCIGGLIASQCSGRVPAESPNVSATAIDVRVDTIVQVITQPPVYVRAPGRIRIDTVIQPTQAIPCPDVHYTATLDTVVNRDTISVAYSHPSTTFTVLLRNAPDSIKTETRTVTVTNRVVERRSWIMDVLTHTGAAAIGYVVASAR